MTKGLVGVIAVTLLTAGWASAQSPDHYQPTWYGSAEYLVWWSKGSPIAPALVTRVGDTAGILAGTPDLGTQTTVFGAGHEELAAQHGARLTLGRWLGDEQRFGVEGTCFYLADEQTQRTAAGDGTTALGLSFFDPTLPGESFTAFDFPGIAAGSHTLSTHSHLWGGELNGVWSLSRGDCFRLDLLGGFRFLRLHEGLQLTSASADSTGLLGGVSTSIVDSFDTENNFYGGQVGARGEYRFGRVILSATGKVALGNVHEIANVSGSTAVSFPGAATTLSEGGFFALSTNSGKHETNEFAVVPEFNVNVGVDVTERLRATVGYNFLYVSSVARPGDQIDHTINPSQLPILGGSAATLFPPSRPEFDFKQSSYWAQGLNFGLELRY